MQGKFREDKKDMQRKKTEAKSVGKLIESINLMPSTRGYQLAMQLLKKDKFDEAERVLNKCIQQTLDYITDLKTLLGIVYAQQNRLTEAENLYRNLLESDPENTSVLINLSNVLTRQKKFDESEKILQELSRLEPNDPAIHIDLGRLYLSLGNKEKAEKELKTASKLTNKKDLQKFIEKLLGECK
jgi:predicted Zn-dependent protease